MKNEFGSWVSEDFTATGGKAEAALPGLGRLIFQAITQRDLVVVQSAVLVLVAAVILVTFLVDLAYAAVDPRLRGR